MTKPTPLTPAVHAVLDAYGDFEAANVDAMAAALRTVANYLDHPTSAHTLYAIADELQAQ